MLFFFLTHMQNDNVPDKDIPNPYILTLHKLLAADTEIGCVSDPVKMSSLSHVTVLGPSI